MLNLPRITGWGTDVVAKTLMEKSDENRRREEEKTKMIGNAILQQAVEGNFTEEGFELVKKQFGPAVAETFKKTAEQATQQNTMKLANMRQEKLLTSLKMRAADLDLIERLDKVDDPETVKMIIGKWNELQDLTGSNAHISPLMEIADRNAQVKKSVTETINKSIAKAEKEPTIDALIQAKKDLISFAKRMDPGIAALYGKRIDAAEGRLKEKTKREEDLKTKEAEEDRKTQTAREDKEYEMTSPDGKRTARFPARLVGKMEEARWKVGAEKKPDTVVNVGNIESKISAEEAAKNIAYLKSPKFRADTIREVQGTDEYKLAATKKEKDEMLRRAAEVSVKNQYPDARYGEFGGKKGFFTIGKSGKPELIAPWN